MNLVRKTGRDVVPGERFPPMEEGEELVIQDYAVLCYSIPFLSSFLFGWRPGFLNVTTRRLVWQDSLTSASGLDRTPVVMRVGEIETVEHMKRFLAGDTLRVTTSSRELEFKIPQRSGGPLIDEYVRLIQKLIIASPIKGGEFS